MLMILILVLLGLIAFGWGYDRWRGGFVKPAQVSDREKGVFLSHPDNYYLDEGADLPVK